MSNIIVTLKANVKQDEDGKIILDETGFPDLIDADDIGFLVKSHPIMTVKFNQESGELDSGYTTRAEVYWDKRRNPSPSLHKPTDLVWLEFIDEVADAVDAEDEDDELESDELDHENGEVQEESEEGGIDANTVY